MVYPCGAWTGKDINQIITEKQIAITTVANAAKQEHLVSSNPVFGRLDLVRGVKDIHCERITGELWWDHESESTRQKDEKEKTTCAKIFNSKKLDKWGLRKETELYQWNQEHGGSTI